MSNLYEISQNTEPLKTCPVLIKQHDPLDPESFGYVPCGTTLEVMVTRTVMGDDYGELSQYGVYFDCGHTLKEMEEHLLHSEYI